MNDQALVDRFLAADTLDSTLIIEMLRDMLWMGWPDQAMLEFFEAVWQVNRNLAPAQRIRRRHATAGMALRQAAPSLRH